MQPLILFLIVWTLGIIGSAALYQLWITYIRPLMPGERGITFDDWFGLWMLFAFIACLLLIGHEFGY